MTDTGLFTDLLNEALENPAYILVGIGFILLCIFVGLLTRKDRKANPEKWARIDANIAANNAAMVANANAQDNTMGTVVINGKMHTTTHVGNTTYIH